MSIDSILISGGALNSYTQGLSAISDNIANMNTTAYKGKRLSFYELPGDSNPNAFDNGSPFAGVQVKGPTRSTKQGNSTSTGNNFDIAIQGNGFFMLKNGNETVYTRAGSFALDSTQTLVHQDSRLPLLAYDANGALNPVVLSPETQVNPGKATSLLEFANVLNSSSTSYTITTPISIYNSLGNSNLVKISFTQDSTDKNTWGVSVKSTDSTPVEYGKGQITFLSSGEINPDKSKFAIAYSPDGSINQAITLDFSKTKSYSTLNSSVSLSKQNGLAAGQMTGTTISDDGIMTATYSNGEKTTLATFALALPNNSELLTQKTANVFSSDNKNLTFKIGKAKKESFGSLQQGALEASNVDLTQEFSNLIITQRGYQAASQVITATNDMLGLLFNIRGKG